MILSLFHRIFKKKNTDSIRKWEKYDSFSEAVNASGGYELVDIISSAYKQSIKHYDNYNNLVLEKKIPNDRLHFQNLYVFQIFDTKFSSKFTVYEVGGSFGTWHHIIHSYLPHLKTNWVIKETNSILNYNKDALKIEHRNLSFVSEYITFNEENEGKVFFCQGALQYLEDPLKSIKWAIKEKFDFIYLTRTPLLINNQESIYFVQKHFLREHAPELDLGENADKIIAIPLTLVSLDRLKAILKPNYEIVFITEESQKVWVSELGNSILVFLLFHIIYS